MAQLGTQVLLLCSAMFSGAALAEDWLRVVVSDSGEPEILEVAVGRFENEDGVRVDLIGVVHVADSEYYASLNRRLAEYDRVLFELVGHPEALNSGADRAPSMIGLLQGGMKNALGLAFQLDEIDYSPANFVHADLNQDEFAASMDDRGESFMQLLVRAWALGMAEQAGPAAAQANADLIKVLLADDRNLALKRALAGQLAGQIDAVADLAGGEGSTLIDVRNEKAIQVLGEELGRGHRKLAIFYGAGHMDDLADRLRRNFAMRQVDTEWLPAWNLRDGK